MKGEGKEVGKEERREGSREGREEGRKVLVSVCLTDGYPKHLGHINVKFSQTQSKIQTDMDYFL